MKPARSKLTYANVMATVAVFLVLAGGTAFAAFSGGGEHASLRRHRRRSGLGCRHGFRIP
jgi:hypothetical protein